MKSDKNGASQCPPGEEHYETYRVLGKRYWQYDYRTPDGRLFSVVRPSLAECREERDEWLRGIALADEMDRERKEDNKKFYAVMLQEAELRRDMQS